MNPSMNQTNQTKLMLTAEAVPPEREPGGGVDEDAAEGGEADGGAADGGDGERDRLHLHLDLDLLPPGVLGQDEQDLEGERVGDEGGGVDLEVAVGGAEGPGPGDDIGAGVAKAPCKNRLSHMGRRGVAMHLS